MSKQLIVNADDFGRHILINRAVERGMAQGLIRSATVMVTGAAFEEAVALARRTPALGLGIHFTLVNAKPVLSASDIPSLVDPATGELYPDHGAFVKRFLTGKIRLQDGNAPPSWTGFWIRAWCPPTPTAISICTCFPGSSTLSWTCAWTMESRRCGSRPSR